MEESVKYYVVIQSDGDKLAKEIETYLAAGWKLQGGVSVSEYVDKGEGAYDYYNNSGITFAQAIIKL